MTDNNDEVRNNGRNGAEHEEAVTRTKDEGSIKKKITNTLAHAVFEVSAMPHSAPSRGIDLINKKKKAKKEQRNGHGM